MGFDPYDESPVKRRGEEYQYQYRHGAGEESSEEGSGRGQRYASPLRYEEGYETYGWERSSPRASPGPRENPSPLLLKGSGQMGRSMSGTPVRGLRGLGQETEVRKGSPLRPRTGTRDEGLGTSPGSGGEGEEEKVDKAE